ncbi:MAG: dTDP-glucose 4,6-dehydratase [Chloroflexi bacterium]|nr:dTDP-glucose 4,6-dehydratase [Chloroflexota bacterium]
MNSILVTGGAGFMGSAFVRYLLREYYSQRVVVLDKLTYAGNLENLASVAADPRYTFIHGDICDAPLVDRVMAEHHIEAVVNFAAETHVDRSLIEADAFIKTDVYGTYVLLEAARRHGVARFLQIGTDEVYGSLERGSAGEGDPLSPRSPYAASKAAGDMMALAYHVSHGLPVMVTRSCNNYGPYQYPEKLIPLFITNAIDDQGLPIYGDGQQVRDWLYVEDHCRAVDVVLQRGRPGEVYNIGAGNERPNLEVVVGILQGLEKPWSLVRHVADRPGHDRRYSLNWGKIASLGWRPSYPFESGLAETIRWYQENQGWWRRIKSGEYADYYRRNYGHRLTTS